MGNDLRRGTAIFHIIHIDTLTMVAHHSWRCIGYVFTSSRFAHYPWMLSTNVSRHPLMHIVHVFCMYPYQYMNVCINVCTSSMQVHYLCMHLIHNCIIQVHWCLYFFQIIDGCTLFKYTCLRMQVHHDYPFILIPVRTCKYMCCSCTYVVKVCRSYMHKSWWCTPSMSPCTHEFFFSL